MSLSAGKIKTRRMQINFINYCVKHICRKKNIPYNLLYGRIRLHVLKGGKKHEAKIFLLLEDILPPIWPQNKIIIGFLKKKILLIILIIVINGI